MKRLLTRLAATVLAAAAMTAPVCADWTYSTIATPTSVTPIAPGGSLSLTSYSPAPGTPSISGNSNIVATTVLGSIGTGTDTYSNAGYSVAISITDKPSGLSKVFTFNGAFSGTFSTTTGSSISNVLIDPTTGLPLAAGLQSVSQTQTIGSAVYTVALNQQVIVGPLGSLPASIGGTVSVVGGTNSNPGGGDNGGGDNGGGGVQATPEPSTMLLSTLGLTVLGLGALRRRLRRQEA